MYVGEGRNVGSTEEAKMFGAAFYHLKVTLENEGFVFFPFFDLYSNRNHGISGTRVIASMLERKVATKHARTRARMHACKHACKHARFYSCTHIYACSNQRT